MERFAPFTLTTDPATKLDPLTVNVKPEPPALTVVGDMVESEGAGLFTVKVRAELVPPPGVDAVIANDPAAARSLLVRVVESCVPLINVVLRAPPLTCKTELLMKLLPVAVSVTGPLPAVAADGEMLLRVGAAAATLRFSVFDVQFPSAEFETVIARFPTWLKSVALSCTLSCVRLTNVVGRPLPFTRTWESWKKLVPFMVTACPELPANTLDGERVRIIGMFEELWMRGLRMAAMSVAEICFFRYECPI